MSCCGVGSEAMSQVLDGQVLIMVRLGKDRGRIQKCLISQEPCQSDLLQTWTVYALGYALPIGGISFHGNDIMGCIQVHAKCIPGGFLA